MDQSDFKPEFCVVGIGASAGGLDALRMLFSRMPPSPGFACVVVMHLSPQDECHLIEMLQSYTQMRVRQVVKTTALERDHVYVIPSDANLNSIDTHLRLSELETPHAQGAPINHLLRSLAATHGETAIGIVLSGAGSDGALGMRQIKEHGGLTLAQDPQEAEYSSMPLSAIDTGTVDLVLSARDMPDELSGYCSIEPSVASVGDDDTLPERDTALLERILGAVRQRTGQEFAMYKRAKLLQRIRRRMRLRHVSSLETYLEVLGETAEEARALYEDLLLNVTEFFGDERSLEQLLTEILERKAESEDRVRVWSIGCSTGEEAYSLGMLLIETNARHGERHVLQVFGSELSANALRQAREGVYLQEIAAAVSQQRLDRFFLREDARYRVRRELRDVVTFAVHDLFKDPPYSRLDLIVCRGLLRDLQPTMRRGVLGLFYYALEPGGLLLVDAHDEIDIAELFTRDAANPAILRRVDGPRGSLQLPAELPSFVRAGRSAGGAPLEAEHFDTGAIFRRAVERYAPPSVLVDREDRVVHFSAGAARYLRIPDGELSLHILKLVPQAMVSELRAGLQHVRREKRAWCSDPFVIIADNGARRMMLRIDPYPPGLGTTNFWLVLFDDGVSIVEGQQSGSYAQQSEQLGNLQAELAAVDRPLARISGGSQRVAADCDTQQNHDRDLHLALEELDATREELQAVNEELISVDAGNRHRIAALADASRELQHLLESSGYATLLLDKQLRIVRFTPLAAALLGLRERDITRPLADLRHHLRYESLVEQLRGVALETQDFEAEIESEDGRWFLLRAQPYRNALQGIDGVVVLFLDITQRKTAELALRQSDRRKEEFLAVLAHELRNPLAPIAAGIELLRKLPDDSGLVLRVVATMSRQTKQLVRLVDDLLEVGRINEGKLLLHPERAGITEAVRDAVAALSPLIESLAHELTLELPAESPVINGDPARLTQMVGNLLHNAVRYTPPHGKLALRVRCEGEQVVISVQDNGRGITAESLPNIFEMFYQERQGEGAGTGLGIGLTLAKKLVELHGGTITAESGGLDQGSTFSLRLPLAKPEQLPGPAPATHKDREVVDHHRVLIVDDNADAAETLRLLMKSMGGKEVRTASSGPEALQAAAQLHPDIVLLDLSMPGMDGFEVARRMRAEPWGRTALLVALTGWGQEQHRRRSIEAGFDRHMTKPADVETLRAVLQT